MKVVFKILAVRRFIASIYPGISGNFICASNNVKAFKRLETTIFLEPKINGS